MRTMNAARDAMELYRLNYDLFLTNGQVWEMIRRVMDGAPPPAIASGDAIQ